MKSALIFGVTGQDGSYLAELLLNNGYEVHGVIRRSSSFNTERICSIFQENGSLNQTFFLHYGDVTDVQSITSIMTEVKPDEIYNLAAQSHVRVSFDIPIYTSQTVAIPTLMILENMRTIVPKAKFYQASSSEMFGSSPPPQNEKTVFKPRSPYAISKVFSYHTVVNYREAYNLFASNGILFNHESPRRGETFVTKKITRSVARIYKKLQEKVFLGNLEAIRDWGYAPEYVEAMFLILQRETPSDYVVATGEMASVREFASAAFEIVGLDYRDYVEEKTEYLRPTEVDVLCGDYTKAQSELGWSPKTKWRELARIMVEQDIYDLEKKIDNVDVR